MMVELDEGSLSLFPTYFSPSVLSSAVHTGEMMPFIYIFLTGLMPFLYEPPNKVFKLLLIINYLINSKKRMTKLIESSNKILGSSLYQ